MSQGRNTEHNRARSSAETTDGRRWWLWTISKYYAFTTFFYDFFGRNMTFFVKTTE